MALIFLKKVWEFLKPSVLPLLVIAVLAFVGHSLFKKSQDDFVDKLQQQKTIHDEEMKKIVAAQELERKQREENYSKLQAALSDAQKKHDDQIKELEKKRAVQVTRLTKQFDSDPSGMASELGKLTGFKVVIPEN
jgi:hypothetical protein